MYKNAQTNVDTSWHFKCYFMSIIELFLKIQIEQHEYNV